MSTKVIKIPVEQSSWVLGKSAKLLEADLAHSVENLNLIESLYMKIRDIA